jgi:hypothetical protein
LNFLVLVEIHFDFYLQHPVWMFQLELFGRLLALLDIVLGVRQQLFVSIFEMKWRAEDFLLRLPLES